LVERCQIISDEKRQTQRKSSESTDSCHGKHSATDVKLPRLINDLMMDKDRQNKYQIRQQDREFLVILFGTHTTGRDT
jgi:hypothetical protein